MRLYPPFRSLVIASLLIGPGTLGSAQAPQRIARVVAHYSAKDGFSGTVTFATAGRVLYCHGYGFADRANKTEFNGHTRLDIGSISKQFTAAAILLLQEDGRLKTSDRVAQLLPEEKLPQAWSEITLRQLLSHTSGIKDYAGAAQERPRDHTLDQLLALVEDAPLKFKPGEGYDYSNTNYLLLGLVVQKIAGMPYCRFLHQRIFNPLGMHDTQCLEEAGAAAHHAIGYAPVESAGGRSPAADVPIAEKTSPSFFFGAGNLLSTGDDLVRWATALHHGRVLSDASYREMTTPVRNGYGYGLQIGSLRGHVRLDHSGSVPGFYSELEYFPGTDDTVVILSNQNGFSSGQYTPGTHVIDSELMTIAADPTAPVPSEGKEVPTSPRVLQLFTGRYVSDDGKQSPFTISLHGKHLQLLQEGPGHSPSELRGDYGELDYYLSDEEADIEFSGQNDAVIFDLRNSQALPFHRVQPAADAPKGK